MEKNKIYTLAQILTLAEYNKFSITTCENEKNGEVFEGVDTLQISAENQDDYFGEFVGDDKKGYTFKLYTI